MNASQVHNDHYQEARARTVHELGLSESGADTAFDRIVRLLRGLIHAPIAAFSVLDFDQQYLRSQECGADRGETSEALSFCTHTIEQGGLLSVADASRDPRFADHPLVSGPARWRFFAGVAVCAPNGLPVGTLFVVDRKPRRLSERERQHLQDLQKLLEETLVLRSMTLIDSLTGLFNRNYLQRVLQAEWHRALRRLLPLSLLLVGIDGFTAYRRLYGIRESEKCLRETAERLKASLKRGADTITRFENGSFAVLLPETPLTGANTVAQRLIEGIQSARLPHAFTGHGVVTVSIGGAAAETPADLSGGTQLFIDTAAAALAEAQQAGANQCVLNVLTRRQPENN